MTHIIPFKKKRQIELETAINLANKARDLARKGDYTQAEKLARESSQLIQKGRA